MSRLKWGTVNVCWFLLGLSATNVSATNITDVLGRATVLIRHFRGDLVASSSGTVVKRIGNDVVIATCAHGFHRGKGPFDVEVTFFTDEGLLYRWGQTIEFDNHLDVGFVRVPNAPHTPSIPLLQRGRNATVGEEVVVAGCDGGGTPIVEVTQVTALGRFAGRPNIEVKCIPKDGRSGGALVNKAGFLLGVCNGINPEDHEGLYAGVEALYQLQDPTYRPPESTPPEQTVIVSAAPEFESYYLRRKRMHESQTKGK